MNRFPANAPFLRVVPALACAALLSSCAVNVPLVPEPHALPGDFSAPGDPANPLPSKWWLHFQDDALSAQMEKALGQNFSLKAARDRLVLARARARASGADLWPSVSGSASAGETWRRVVVTETVPVESSGSSGSGSGGGTSSGGTGSGSGSGSASSSEAAVETRTSLEIENSRDYGFGLSASYELDLWGRVRYGRNAAALDAAASAQDLQAAAITLSGNVASTWYRLQEQREQIAVLDKQIATTSSTLELIETRFRRGSSAASDVLQQKQLLESRQEERLRALAAREDLEISLAILLGESPRPGRYEAEGGRLVELPALPAAGVPAELVERRPDARSARLAVQAADQRLGQAIAARYPRISLTGSFNGSNGDWEDLFDNWIASLAANLAVPILDGGRLRAEEEQARASTLEAFHAYGQTILEALGEVERALAAENRQRAVVESIERQLALAAQVVERLRAEYLGGKAEYLRVLDAQQSEQNLERELLTARRALIGFRVDLCRALAGGWTLEGPSPDAAAMPGRESAWPLPIPVPGPAPDTAASPAPEATSSPSPGFDSGPVSDFDPDPDPVSGESSEAPSEEPATP